MKFTGMLVLAFLVIIAGAVFIDMFASSKKSKDVSLAVHDVPLKPETWQDPPDVSMIALDGRTFALSSYKGKVVILNFWATWCPSCKIEFASLLKLVRDFKGKVVLLAVSADRDQQELEAFLNGLRPEFAQELDGGNVLIPWDPERHITSDVFQTERFPEAIILSKDLRMARKIVGSFDWESAEIKKYINNLLAL